MDDRVLVRTGRQVGLLREAIRMEKHGEGGDGGWAGLMEHRYQSREGGFRVLWPAMSSLHGTATPAAMGTGARH